MKLSFSTVSTINASFAEDVAAYAAAGFDAIGLWEVKLPADDGANLALLREHGLAVSNCVPTVPSFLQLGVPGLEGPAEPAERLAAICASIERLAAYEPDCVLVLTGPSGDRSDEEARTIVRDGLVRAAAAARDAGVRLGFEPIHPDHRAHTGFVCSLADAVALLGEARLDDVGIMADTYNLAREAPADLAALADRLTGLHVAELPTAGDASGPRALPGEGDGSSARVVRALREAGWDGTLDVEIFSTPDGFWALPVDEAARRAHAAASSLAAQTVP